MRLVKVEEGTNFAHGFYLDEFFGYFHCWAGTSERAYAVIEERKQYGGGKIFAIDADKLEFIYAPNKEGVDENE